MGKIDKINRTVLSEEIKSDLDSKATKTELLNVKAELENQINNVVSNLVRKPSVLHTMNFLLLIQIQKKGGL